MNWINILLQAVGYLLLCVLIATADQRNHLSTDETGPMGRRLFVQYCSACHGMDGQGNGPVASVLSPPPADLTRIAQRRGGHFPAAEIAATIDGRAEVRAHGSRSMPVWGERLSEHVGGGSLGEEVAHGNVLVLINYLQTIQQ
ncbi:MAG TPA: cytochrome c [Candidatus Tectomicrobia bacterium]|jgi:mono/diheme cytochrome c family protein